MQWKTPARLGTLAAALALVAAGELTALTSAEPAAALENSVARTPPMGWNDWNTFGCQVDEALIRQTADAVVSNGMAAAGYRYVNVDDCWFNPQRDAQGNLQPNLARFPSGMKALGDYLHGKGLKFGLYESPVDKTCAQYFGAYPGATGSGGHETADARQFAAWGVDYLKYDWCSTTGTTDQQVATFARMRDALAATGRPIVLSINSNSVHPITGPSRDWGDVSNSWRVSEDITTRWDTGNANAYPMGVRNIVAANATLAANAGPGHLNDMDMLEVGVPGNLTDTEQRTNFAMWSVMGSPLIAGADLRTASASTLAIYENANLIGINQDSLALQAVQVAGSGTQRVFSKPLANGDRAVALYNEGGSTATITTSASVAGLGAGSSYRLVNAWTNAVTSTSGTISASVPAHGTVVYRVSGGTPARTLRTESSGRCLDVPRSTLHNGTQPSTWTCSGAPNQRFTVTAGGALVVLGRCLDAEKAGTAPGTRVLLWNCNGQANQRWRVNPDGTVVGVQSGLCLDVTKGLTNTGNGQPVGLWTCNGQANQRWTLS